MKPNEKNSIEERNIPPSRELFLPYPTPQGG